MSSGRKLSFHKIWIFLLIAALIPFGIWVYTAMQTPSDDVPFERDVIRPTDTVSDDCAAAYNEVIAQYRAVLNLTAVDWQSDTENYAQTYPYINPAYVGFYHLGMVNTLYAACYDIDGNGTDELFIGLGDRRDATEVGVYAFDGTRAVTLSLTDTASGYQILTDGLFIQSDNDGTIRTVKCIAEDGRTLENTDADIQSGDALIDVDLTAHGGNLTLTNWQKVALK